jgi:hypothetical protein
MAIVAKPNGINNLNSFFMTILLKIMRLGENNATGGLGMTA